MEPTQYTFTVTGPISTFGTWRMGDATEYLWGAHTPEPMTITEIEELVGVFAGHSPITWDGLVGEYTTPHEIGAYTITLTEVES